MVCIVYAPNVHGGTAEPDGLDRSAIISLGEKGCLPCIQCSRNGMVPVLNHEISEGANDPAQVNLGSGSKKPLQRQRPLLGSAPDYSGKISFSWCGVTGKGHELLCLTYPHWGGFSLEWCRIPVSIKLVFGRYPSLSEKSVL